LSMRLRARSAASAVSMEESYTIVNGWSTLSFTP
jgi:hypothetical protein